MDKDRIFEIGKHYFLQIQTGPDREIIKFHHAKILDETENFFLILDAKDGTKKGFAKVTLRAFDGED